MISCDSMSIYADFSWLIECGTNIESVDHIYVGLERTWTGEEHVFTHQKEKTVMLAIWYLILESTQLQNKGVSRRVLDCSQ